MSNTPRTDAAAAQLPTWDEFHEFARSLERELEKLKDPVSVQVNMLRGFVARITMDACAHSHGAEAVNAYHRLQADAELGQIAMRYVDRMADPDPCDPLERSVKEFTDAIAEAVTRLRPVLKPNQGEQIET